MARNVDISGVPVTVISDEEAETMDYLVCAPLGPSPFNDNLTGFCSKCGIKVMYRWHAPRKPPRICLECLSKLAKKIGVQTEDIKREREGNEGNMA